MNSTVWIIGEAPESGDLREKPSEVLAGRIGKRLAQITGVSFDHYLSRTQRRNLFDVKPEWWSKSDANERAQLLARRMRDESTGIPRVVLLGTRVAEAFRVNAPLFTWQVYELPGPSPRAMAMVVRIPHPSGRNRQMNDPATQARVGYVLASVLA